MHCALENVASNTATLLQPSVSIPQKASSNKGKKFRGKGRGAFAKEGHWQNRVIGKIGSLTYFSVEMNINE
jgi:hypothetical protein